MSDVILSVENISKQYQLGVFGTGTLKGDVHRWWCKLGGREDPFLKNGDINDRSVRGESSFFWALQDINFEVKRGEVLGIIGKNGAGKSTLLKLLSRVTAPTMGTIRAKGRIGSLLEVGTGFHPELTGKENIFLNGAILGMTKVDIRKKYDEIVNFSGCERYIDTPVKRYSSGMRVRLGFAVAAFLDPEILVVDEVLAVGDAEFQKKAIGKMKDVSHHEGRTVLFVSHNMSSVRNLCESGILLENGVVIDEGGIGKVVDQYLKNSSVQEDVPLSERSDRKGSGKILITNIDIVSKESGKVLNEVVSGMDVEFLIYYFICDDALIGSDVEIGMVVQNAQGQFVTVFNNMMAGEKIKLTSKEGVVVCDTGKIPLMEGEYHIRSMIKSVFEMYDMVEKAKVICLHQGDYYCSGKINSSGRQGVYVNQAWNIKEYL